MKARRKSNAWVWIVSGLGIATAIVLLNRKRVMKELSKVRLSENFVLSEFVKTSTGAENIPGPKEIENLRLLAIHILQPLRNAVSKRYPGRKVAIAINSGYRSPLVNNLVPGSSKTSQHMTGQASDMRVLVDGKQLPNDEVIKIIREEKLPYDQVIDEQRGKSLWVHVSYNHGGGRKEWLTRRDPGPDRPREYEMVKIG